MRIHSGCRTGVGDTSEWEEAAMHPTCHLGSSRGCLGVSPRTARQAHSSILLGNVKILKSFPPQIKIKQISLKTVSISSKHFREAYTLHKAKHKATLIPRSLVLAED